MNAKLSFTNGVIKYTAMDTLGMFNDKDWAITVSDTKIIGIWDKMVGDEDTTFLIFVDSNGKSYAINLTYSWGHIIEELDRVIKFVNIKIDPEIKYPKATIVFPSQLRGKQLYKNKLLTRFKVFFGIYHPATGDLSTEVQNYLKS